MHSQQSETRKTHRRSRIPLSCDPCRSRKLKCNREKPCQNCTARDEQAACKFRGPVGGSPPSATGGHRAQSGARTAGYGDRSSIGGVGSAVSAFRSDATVLNGDAMRQRIDHLEELVRRLIAERVPAPSPPQSHSSAGPGVYTPQKSPRSEVRPNEAQVPHEVSGDMAVGTTGKTVIDGVHSVYLGSDDWSVVLQEINELKKTWTQGQQDDASDQAMRLPLSHTVDGSSLLFDQVKPLERIGIISTLPPKHEVDWLITQFFNRSSFPLAIPPIVHEPTFMREYNEHWREPSRTGFIWLGLLFSILSITMLAYHQYGEPPEYEGLSESLFQLYRMRTAQCLLSGDIAKCLPYTVETLRFNATAELNRKDDNRRGLWIMTGVIMRAAINMGYHRDPAKLPGISALQAEYRRRVWSSVVSLDDMASFLGGFPRTMAAVYSDTLEPRNLHDWELTEDINVLPQPRPLIEPTATTYLIVKSRLLYQLGRVADFNCNPSLCSYETVLEIDRAVQEVYESLPPFMKAPSVLAPAQAERTPPVRTRSLANFANLSLIGMYHRGVCTLHRRFLAKGRLDGRFQLSHDRCISSAMALLAFQEILEPAFYKISQTRQMLMLGTMVLFHELALRRKVSNEVQAAAVPDSAVLLQKLERSCTLLVAAMDGCDEVKRIHHFLESMLTSFRAGSKPMTPETTPLESEQFQAIIDSPAFDFSSGGFTFEKNWVDMDFDWVTWDNFIDESNYEMGPTY